MKPESKLLHIRLAPLLLLVSLWNCQDSADQQTSSSSDPPSIVDRQSSTSVSYQSIIDAYALDSIDYNVFQNWNRFRKKQNSDSLNLWLKAHYWPLQSIGLRLIELAIVDLSKGEDSTGQAKLDTARAIGNELAMAFKDSLLFDYSRFIVNLKQEQIQSRAELSLKIFEAQELYYQRKIDEGIARLLEIREQAAALDDHILSVDVGLSILEAYSFSNERIKVVEHSREVLAEAERIGYSWALAQALNLVADAYRVLDKDEQALASSLRARQIAERLADRRTLVDAYFYQARILERMERYLEAEQALENVIALDHDKTYTSDAMLLKGQLALNFGEYGLAQEYFEQAIAGFKAYDQPINQAVALNHYSILLREMGDYQNALQKELEAFSIYQRSGAENRLAWSFINQGTIYSRLDSLNKAETAFHKASQIFERTGQRRPLIDVLLRRANLHSRKKEFDLAKEVYVQADSIARDIDYYFGLAGAALGQAHIALSRSEIDLADSLYSVAGILADSIKNEALMIEARYGHAIVEKKRKRYAASFQYFDEAITGLERLFLSITKDSLRVTYFATTQEIFDEAVLLATRLQLCEKALRYAERARARAMLEALGQAFKDSALTFVELIPSVQDFQRLMPADSKLIEYRVTADELIIWVVGASEFVCRTVPLSKATLNDSIQVFMKSIGARGYKKFRDRVEKNIAGVYSENRRLGKALFDMLLSPVAESLDSTETLYVVPDGAIHQIPFGALVTDDGRFLEEEYSIAKSASLTLLYQGLLRPVLEVPGLASNHILLVSNPAGDFPAAEDEVRNVSRSFNQASVLSQEQATFSAVVDRLQTGAEVAHFSLHAVADPQRPFNSYLELSDHHATAFSPSTERVFARQLLNLKMDRTWLVMLNGCETASGRIVAGAGVLNFVRIFMLKQVPVVVASLWKNDDRVSQSMMTFFYQELESRSNPIAALQASKRKVMKTLTEDAGIGYPLPYFWAVFEIYINRSVKLTDPKINHSKLGG